MQSTALLATFTCDSPPKCCALANDGKLTAAGDVGGCLHFLRVEELGPKARAGQRLIAAQKLVLEDRLSLVAKDLP